MHDFMQRFVILSDSDTEIPFTVGGVTQHGEHTFDGQNNQDACSLSINDKNIIAVVCDGCSGSTSLGNNMFSYAESGAQILSALIIQHTESLLNNKYSLDEKFAKQLSTYCIDSIDKIIDIISGKKDSYRSEYILQELFMATIIVAVITPEYWAIFKCGDGFIGINGNFDYLNKTSSGIYISSYLSNMINEEDRVQCNISLYKSGNTNDLDSLMIASDGMYDFWNEGKQYFNDFQQIDPKKNYKKGFDNFFLKEFRKRVTHPCNQFNFLQKDGYDDRTMILIRRIS